jgi:hypothetical protein
MAPVMWALMARASLTAANSGASFGRQGQVLRPERGHQLLPSGKGDKEIGDRINKIIGRLADANDSLKGAINVDDFNVLAPLAKKATVGCS